MSYKKIADTFWKESLSPLEKLIAFSLVGFIRFQSNIAVSSLKQLCETVDCSSDCVIKILQILYEKEFIEFFIESTDYESDVSFILSYASSGATKIGYIEEGV